RRSGKPLVLVANKAESREADAGIAEAWEIGLGEPVALSAEHGIGLDDLREAIVTAFGGSVPERAETAPLKAQDELPGETIEDPDSEDIPAYDATKPLRIAVVGRPNAGKSTLVNSLI